MKHAFLALAMLATAPASADTLIVHNDNGGRVDHRLQAIAGIEQRGDSVRVSGHCYSACTMYLALGPDRLCAEPGVMFGFHAATNARTGAALPLWTAVMATHYPEKVRNWFYDHAAHVTTGLVQLRGSDMIMMGFVSECEQ